MMSSISYDEELKRKLIHLSSTWIVLAILLMPKYWAAGLFALLGVLTFITESCFVRNVPVITPFYRFFFGKMLRDEQKQGKYLVSCGFYVFAAAALCTLFFHTLAAAGGMLVMLYGDTAAALIGRKFGRRKFANGKSHEGFAAFLIAGYLALTVLFLCCGSPVYYYLWAIPAVFAGSLAELYEKNLHIDDNFSIPVVCGSILYLGITYSC